MSILKTTGLIAGHYECRSLAETLPVFTDLLAMEIVEQEAGRSHAQTSEHRLALDRPRRRARRAGEDFRQSLRLSRRRAMKRSKPPGNTSKRTKRNTISARSPSRRALISLTRSIFASPAAITGNRILQSRRRAAWPLAHRRPLGQAAHRRAVCPSAATCRKRSLTARLQCDNIERSRRFYIEVLGLEIAAGFNTAQYIKHPASPWYIVVLQTQPAPISRAGESLHFANGFSRGGRASAPRILDQRRGRRHHRARQARRR